MILTYLHAQLTLCFSVAAELIICYVNRRVSQYILNHVYISFDKFLQTNKMLMMTMVMRLQIAAAALRAVTSGGYNTKIIALGIGAVGSDLDQSELEGIATDPDSRNFILVADFNSLNDVEDELRDITCKGNSNYIPYTCQSV